MVIFRLVQPNLGLRAVPDDVGRSLPLLGQQLWVVHDLLQEGNDLCLQLIVCLKVLSKIPHQTR